MKQKSQKILVLLSFILLLSPIKAEKTIKILAIGNSFSEDAAESYVDDLAKADGVQLIIANLYIGGCSLETHKNNAAANSPAYSYRKIVNGDTTRLESKTMAYALTDENWDYISFQQVSQYSGRYNTYFPYLTYLINYVKEKATNPAVQFCLHRTWAYASNSTHSEYDYYQKNQMIMFDSIVNATNKAANTTGINIIIPAGTAIQNGRSSYIGDNFNRDGYHLSYGMGRYTAACTWYEKMLGKPVTGNSFAPKGLSATDTRIAQQAAHYAVTEPDKITIMTPKSVEFAKMIQIDFGNASNMAGSPWNNLTSTKQGSTVSNLLDIDGNSTNVSISVSDAFGGINANGPGSVTTSLPIPSAASADSFWGNGTGAFTGISEPTGGFTVTGLNPEKEFDFHFFSSRTGSADNRETTFTVSGNNRKIVSVNSSENTSNIASVTGISPKQDGSVTIDLKAGENNNNSYKFFYVNTLQIIPSNQISGTNTAFMKNIKIYPNPVNDYILIESDQKISKAQISDISGRVILEVNNLQSGLKSIDTSALKSGFYILKTECGINSFIKK
jgi:hypothetical protein